MKEKVRVFKIGGKVIDNEELLIQFLRDFAKIDGKKILIHGGGKIATSISEKLGITTQMVNGRRITDKDTIDVVVMVYGGLINKKIVAALQSLGCNAVGLSGADLNIVFAKKRPVVSVDYGFVGDVEQVNHETLGMLLGYDIVPVLAPLSHDGHGQMLNINADTIAAVAAVGLSKLFEVELFYCFEKPGVLMDQHDDSSVIKKVTPSYFIELKNQGVVSDGMLPKLENSFECIQNGVKKVIICHFSAIGQLGEAHFPGTVLFG